MAAASPAFAAKGVALHHEVGAGVPRVAADAERLADVLASLVDNALRHTPAGRTVTVSARARAPGAPRRRRHRRGHRPAGSPSVFERFYRGERSRARPAGEGSGIGLTIARALVEAHGGTIRLAGDESGRGTCVEIDLPVGE